MNKRKIGVLPKLKQTNKYLIEDEEHIYFDITLENPITSTIDDLFATFDVSYNQNVIDDPGLYNFTIAKLSIPGSEIPLLLAAANTYSVTLSYDGNDYQTFLDWGAADGSFIRTVNRVVETVNAAFAASFTALKAAHAGAPGTTAPWMVYDNNSRNLTIHVETLYSEVYAGPPVIEIWVNLQLTHLLGVLHFSQFFSPELANGKAGQVAVVDLGFNREAFQFPTNAFGVTSNALYLPQAQGNCLNTISQLRGFVITSNSLNLRLEASNKSNLVDLTNEYTASDYTQFPAIFDLSVANPGDSITDTYVYIPSLYRWLDVLSFQDINRIQFTAYFLLNDGNLYPVGIGIGRTMSIKFLFQKKQKFIQFAGDQGN